MLDRAVPEKLISQYQGQDVFIFKDEPLRTTPEGRSFNLAVPDWQLENFNTNYRKAISAPFYRAPLGPQLRPGTPPN